MSRPHIDKLYIYDQGVNHFDKLRKTVQEVEYSFRRANIPEKAKPGEITHYAQTFTIGEKTRTFLLITKNKKNNSIDKFFNESLVNVKGLYLDKFNQAGSVPLELDIWYVY